MKKARDVQGDTLAANRRETAPKQSNERLRRLLKQAQRTTDQRERAELKQQFIREFYVGSH
jgi:hypothetical protein